MNDLRSKSLQQIRPLIPVLSETGATSTAEQFQNQTLRPVLKYQHDLLIAIFRQYCHERKGSFFQLPKEKKFDYIDQATQRDFRFRNFLLGNITGMFTLEEYRTFLKNKSELTRRAMGMLAQRLKDSLSELTAAL